MAIIFPRRPKFLDVNLIESVNRPASEIWPDPCPVTGRRRVTLKEWCNRPQVLIDAYAYFFNIHEARVGFDPWRTVEGVEDKSCPPPYAAECYDVLFLDGRFAMFAEDPKLLYVDPEHYEAIKLGK